jgi:hypothetical protein
MLNTDWGSKLITPRGREVLKPMEKDNLKHLSSGEPTYLPSDRNKLPDLVDFCVTKGIPLDFATVKSCFNLSSDPFPVLITRGNEKYNHVYATDIQIETTSGTSSTRNKL